MRITERQIDDLITNVIGEMRIKIVIKNIERLVMRTIENDIIVSIVAMIRNIVRRGINDDRRVENVNDPLVKNVDDRIVGIGKDRRVGNVNGPIVKKGNVRRVGRGGEAGRRGGIVDRERPNEIVMANDSIGPLTKWLS